uniref:Uncharacterized protein n=1 Tax=uncultured marine virus TaxID=186617 RepID=A0A0F7L782_9VIRU|nr:hypothetical protein [uncultured marine virus]
MNTSQMFKINWRDVGKGLITAILAAVLTYVLQLINAPGFSFAGINWADILRIAFASGVGYILKNFLTDSQGNFGGIL